MNTITNRAMIDMDGVLLDMVSQVAGMWGFDPSEFENLWLNNDEIAGCFDLDKALSVAAGTKVTSKMWWDLVDKRGHQFWSYMCPYGWTYDLIKLIKSYFSEQEGIFILSSPSRHPTSASGKVEAIQNLMGVHFRNYALCPPKHIAANPHTVLIDDYDSNLETFRLHGGKTVLVPQPWNSGYNVRRLWQAEAQEMRCSPAVKWEYINERMIEYINTQLRIVFDGWALDQQQQSQQSK